MKRRDKEKSVKEWVDRLNRASGVYLTDFRGLNVEAMTDLRAICRREEAEYRVVKNTLLRRALEELGNDGLLPFLTGPTGVLLVYDDPLKPARFLRNFVKEKAPIRIKAAYGEGQLFLPDQISRLALIPSRDELIAQLIGRMRGPIYSLNCLLHGLLWKLVHLLDQIVKGKDVTKEE